MAKFIKSKFRVLWSTIFTFFAGIFSMEALAQDVDDKEEDTNEEAKEVETLDPGAIAAAACCCCSFNRSQ